MKKLIYLLLKGVNPTSNPKPDLALSVVLSAPLNSTQGHYYCAQTSLINFFSLPKKEAHQARSLNRRKLFAEEFFRSRTNLLKRLTVDDEVIYGPITEEITTQLGLFRQKKGLACIQDAIYKKNRRTSVWSTGEFYGAYYPAPKLLLDNWSPLSSLNSRLLSLFLQDTMVAFLGYHANWAFIDITKAITKPKYIELCRALYTTHNLQGLYTNPNTFCTWFSKLFYFKDPQGLSFLISNWLLKTEIKHHKKVFLEITSFLDFFFLMCGEEAGIKGLFIYFKGKLAKKGSVRKEKIFKKIGRVALGTKSLRGRIIHYQVPTLTGVIGSSIGIFYPSMLTISMLYLIFYILTLGSLILLLNANKLLSLSSGVSLNVFVSFIQLYSRGGNLFRLLLLQLSGLAPSALFFIKFNFIITTIGHSHIISLLLIASTLVLTTYFYLQNLPIYNQGNSLRVLKQQRMKKTFLRQHTPKYWVFFIITGFIAVSTISFAVLPLFFTILENIFF